MLQMFLHLQYRSQTAKFTVDNHSYKLHHHQHTKHVQGDTETNCESDIYNAAKQQFTRPQIIHPDGFNGKHTRQHDKSRMMGLSDGEDLMILA